MSMHGDPERRAIAEARYWLATHDEEGAEWLKITKSDEDVRREIGRRMDRVTDALRDASHEFLALVGATICATEALRSFAEKGLQKSHAV